MMASLEFNELNKVTRDRSEMWFNMYQVWLFSLLSAVWTSSLRDCQIGVHAEKSYSARKLTFLEKILAFLSKTL